MKNSTEKDAGKRFTKLQKSTDTAINERIKSDKGKSKLSPEEATNPKNRDRKSDTPSKKTGGGKQKNPGM